MLRAFAGRERDAVGVDDTHQDNGFAQHIRRARDGIKIGRVLAGLDAPSQIQERFVDLPNRTEHVLFEYHRKVLVGPFGFAPVAADVFNVFQADALPTAWR